MSRSGLTLLEVMVALVILSMVVVGYLQIFSASSRTSRNTETWSTAIAYASQGMEYAKLDLTGTLQRGQESLEGGFLRQISVAQREYGLRLVTVTVFLPGGGDFTLNRLILEP